MRNETLRQELIDELSLDSRVDFSNVSVTVSDHCAILQGKVHAYPEKCRCEQIAKRIRGITSVRNEIDVRLTISDYRGDATLQRIVTNFLDYVALLPHERPRASVKDGRVTLEGSVAFAFQRRLAEEAIGIIAGVRSINNRIEVRPRVVPPEDLEARLRAGLRRREPYNVPIEVTAEGGRITLRGTVLTCAERDDMVALVWCAPGVTFVEDNIQVQV